MCSVYVTIKACWEAYSLISTLIIQGFYYYLTYRVTNDLPHTVYLYWRMASQATSLVSTSPAKYKIDPKTKDRVIKITFTSDRRLTAEELRQATSLVTGKNFDEVSPVFVNGRDAERVPITFEEGKGTEIRFSEYSKLYILSVIYSSVNYFVFKKCRHLALLFTDEIFYR